MGTGYPNVWYTWMDTASTTASTTWLTWTSQDTGTATITYDNAWTSWVTASNTTITVTGNTDQSWGQWVTNIYEDHTTPEQRAAQQARWDAERAETQRRANESLERTRQATERARALLHAMLDAQQRQSLQTRQFFEVIAKGSRRRYRIYQGTHGNVKLLDDQGREVTRYCGQPNGVPTEDAMLAQKLQIEHDEATFVRLSNATRLTA